MIRRFSLKDEQGVLRMDCVFCKIIAGDIPSTKVYEDKYSYAFADIKPEAPVHILVVPKQHIPSLAEMGDDDERRVLLGHLHHATREIARAQKLKNGFRVVINTGDDGGQTVDHLHFHLLGGRVMHWPPG
jgi:histidine triad (HIT) family protein